MSAQKILAIVRLALEHHKRGYSIINLLFSAETQLNEMVGSSPNMQRVAPEGATHYAMTNFISSHGTAAAIEIKWLRQNDYGWQTYDLNSDKEYRWVRVSKEYESHIFYRLRALET